MQSGWYVDNTTSIVLYSLKYISGRGHDITYLHPIIIHSFRHSISSYGINFHDYKGEGLVTSPDAKTTLPVLNPLGDNELAGDRKLPAAATNALYSNLTWYKVMWELLPFTNILIFFIWFRADAMTSSTCSLYSSVNGTCCHALVSKWILTLRTSITIGIHLLPVASLNCTAACSTLRHHYVIIWSSYFLQSLSFSTAYHRIASMPMTISIIHRIGFTNLINISAILIPIPDPPPVMKATWSFNTSGKNL